MAILEQWPGLKVSVKIAGQPATEYQDQQASPDGSGEDPRDSTEPPPSTCCYIESTTGLSFCVEAEIDSEFELPAPYELVVLRVTVDGVPATGAFRFVVGEKVVRPVTMEVDHIDEPTNVLGQIMQRFFTFAPVSAIEDAEKSRIMRDAKTADSLGKIIAEVSIAFGARPSRLVSKATSLPDTFQLAEKAMKGHDLTHGTKFSSGPIAPARRPRDFRSERVLGTFVFMYRSRGALQRAMVLPPSRSSSPPTDECEKLESMGEDELRKLARDLLRSRKPSTLTGSLSVKRDPDDDDTKTHARKSKRVKSGSAEQAIDLTSD